jgi:hypothetical protein
MSATEPAVPEIAKRLQRRINRAKAQPTESLVLEAIRAKKLLKEEYFPVAQAFRLEAIRIVFAERGVLYDFS